jgi:hypothetical protein
MLDIEQIKKDINSIFNKYTSKNGKKPFYTGVLDKDIGNYIRKIHEEIKDLEFSIRCQEMNKVYKIINDVKSKK